MDEIKCGGKTYRIIRQPSHGGMGIIYPAEDVSSGQKVAIKTPRTTGSPQEDRYRIERVIVEGRILSILNHPHIVKLVYSSYDPIPMLVMEYIEGPSFYRAHCGKPLNEKALVSWASQVLDAVGYLHNLNIVHRDINPNNILFLSKEKIAKQIDFGTAKYYYLQSTKEGDPVWPVTPGFTAPEQELYGLSSMSTDIYSTAATLYFLCTGKNPRDCFKGKSIIPPSKLNSEISERISEDVLTGMNPNSSLRYATANDFLMALQGIAPTHLHEPYLIAGGGVHKIREGIEIGRRHEKCPGCIHTRYNRVDIQDPFYYVHRHHSIVYRKGPNYAIEFIGDKNNVHLIYTDPQGKLVVKKIERGKLFFLRDGDQIALCYDDRLGPYVLIRFFDPTQRSPTEAKGGAHVLYAS